MKKNVKLFTLLFFVSLMVTTAYGQSYDCQTVNNQYRTSKNVWIADENDTPFNDEDLQIFKGLFYYPVDCKYVINGKLERNEPMQIVHVITSNGDTVQLYDYGTVKCIIGDQEYSLKAYKNINLPEFAKSPETVFVPFKDETNGPKPKTTFDQGRYLIIQPSASGNQVMLDFNRATNPFENYNSSYSTIFIEPSNIIEAPLYAGERKYEDR